MARLDLGGLRDLWYRIDDIFARITEAAGSIALSGTSLVLNAVSGNQLSSVDLNGTFATDAEAAHSLTWNSPNLTLNSVSGGSLGSVNLNNGLVTDAELTAFGERADDRYGASLNVNNNNQVQLISKDGTALSTTKAFATQQWVNDNFIASVSVYGSTAEGGTLYLNFKNGFAVSLYILEIHF